MSRATAHTIEAVERERKALAAALSGKSFDDIATEVGYSNRGTAWRAVQRALKRTIQPAADEYRAIELMRLDGLLLALWPRAIGSPASEDQEATAPDYQAIDRVLKIAERRAKLLGLDAPVKVDVGALVAEMARRHNLAAEEARVCTERIEAFLSEQRAGVSP